MGCAKNCLFRKSHLGRPLLGVFGTNFVLLLRFAVGLAAADESGLGGTQELLDRVPLVALMLAALQVVSNCLSATGHDLCVGTALAYEMRKPRFSKYQP